jgi:TolA-binding protein
MVSLGSVTCFAQIAVIKVPARRMLFLDENLMIARVTRSTFLISTLLMAAFAAAAHAQDVPGIEICTVEKTMERRTSCLQSNVDFLQKTITKLASDHQQKIDAANRQVEALKSTVAGLQKIVDELKTAQSKAAEDAKKPAAPAAKDTAPAAKDGTK